MDRRAHHRACVHRALSAWLEGAVLLRCFQLWEREYAHLPLFSLGEFARRSLPEMGVHVDPDRLRDRVMSCLRDTRHEFERTGAIPMPVSSPPAPASDARPAPEKPQSAGGAQAASPRGVDERTVSRPSPPADSESGLAAEFVVFRRLVESLAPALWTGSESGRVRFREQLLERFAAGEGALDVSAVLVWLETGRTCPPATAWTRALMHDLLHRVYVHLCEAHGPVTGDRLLSRAVIAAESLPEAARFSPRRLL